MSVQIPETRFATVGADRVGYQISGDGPRDLLFTSGLWSHLDVFWEEPSIARFIRQAGQRCRLIRFDRRGSGLSDPRPNDGGSLLDHWSADVQAVLLAAGAVKPMLLCTIDSGPMVLEFIDRHPDTFSALAFVNTTACLLEKPGYPEGHPAAMGEAIIGQLAANWGREDGATTFAPSQADNPQTLRWYAKFQRAMASPRAVAENLALSSAIDARHVLPKIAVPTLVVTRRDLRLFPARQARYMAEHIPGARYVELDGEDMHLFWEHADEMLAVLNEFITGRKSAAAAADRELATVLFTDIVDSTRFAAKLGDAAWRALLDQHDRIVREQLSLHNGRLVDSAGDGTLATFTRPAAAIDCAQVLIDATREARIKLRTGLHIGEIELREDGRIGGIAVHIGARVLSLGKPGEVTVSRTLRDVLIGSRYKFKDRGIHELKGVPSRWPLYAASR